MATAVSRYALRTATRSGGGRTFGSKRNFASSARRRHDDAYEAEKWEKITYAGIFTCTVLAIYNLSKPHRHYEEPPPYPYLRSRQKDVPPAPGSRWSFGKEALLILEGPNVVVSSNNVCTVFLCSLRNFVL